MIQIKIKQTNPKFEEAVKKEKELAKKRFEKYFNNIKNMNN